MWRACPATTPARLPPTIKKKEDAAEAAPSSKSCGGALMALGEGVMRNTSLLHPREQVGLDA